MTSKPYLSLSKTVCQHCGTINATNGKGDYSFGKNVYSLNSCDHNFFHDFDSTTYEQYNSRYHTKIEKEGEYCQYCKGTHATAEAKQEKHSFTETVEPQLGNQRFHLTGVCDDCGYIHDEYTVAKSVVESYYGNSRLLSPISTKRQLQHRLVLKWDTRLMYARIAAIPMYQITLRYFRIITISR